MRPNSGHSAGPREIPKAVVRSDSTGTTVIGWEAVAIFSDLAREAGRSQTMKPSSSSSIARTYA